MNLDLINSGVSMARERDSKVVKAFAAMKSIGIAPEVVKPVLKSLLKLYDRNWELIEEDNYRTLADAIFEFENDKMVEKNDVPELEPPYKKPHGAVPEDQDSSTLDNQSRIIDPEEGEIPKHANGLKLAESSQSSSVNPRSERSFLLCQASIRNKGKAPVSMCSFSTGDNLVSGNISSELCLNQAPNERGFLHEQRERIHEICDGGHVINPERIQPLNCLPLSVLPSSNVSPDEHNQPAGSPCNHGASLQYMFDIASSSCGRVKICLSYNHACGQPNFQSPNLEAVLRYAENKCLRSYRILDPNFSLVRLMKGFCDSYVELGTDSAKRPLANKAPSDCLHHIIGSNNKPPRTDKLEKDINKRVTNCSTSSSSLNRAVVSRDKRRSIQKIHDITNGTETMRISLLDETGREQIPNFVYVPENIVYQNAYIHISMARIADEDCCASCTGDCLSSSIPCACARDTGGEFAYTPEGLLREEFLRACISMNAEPQKHYHFYCYDCPLERAKNGDQPEKCKGHLLKKFIKECWRKCRCNMKCGNRVVQRGITCKLQVFSTDEGKGWGLRALEELPEGAFVCEYVGEILTNMELYERNKQNSGRDRHTYPVLLDADWGSEGVLKDEEALCLDATYYGNVARFINHRCYDANLIEIPVEVETPDHHYYHLAFFTKRKVNAFEELTWDYRIDFNDHNHPIEAFLCCCGSPYCRGNKGKRAKVIASQ